MRQRCAFATQLLLFSLFVLAWAPLAQAQTSDQAVYTDSLQNGWQNYGWATLNFSNPAPVHSGSDSISVTAGAYQALYLHHAAQDSTPYASLTFWIDGGTGGQRLQVQATLSGTTQQAVALGPLVPNTWQKVTIGLDKLGVTNNTNFDGFWIQDTTGQSQPIYYVDDIALNAGTIVVPPNPAVTVSVDANANRHPISPLVYGVAYGTTSELSDLNAPLNRLGGNNTSRYNWQLNADNRANDYFFESIGDTSSVAGERGDTFISTSKAGGADAMLTIPMVPWIAKLGPNRGKLASFSVAKYGAQQSTDPYFPDAGNGVKSGGGYVTGNDPNDANVANSPSYEAGWISHLVGTWGLSSSGGLKYYILDNEPSIWNSTHRDVHPNGETLDEIKGDILTYGAQVKAADPNALVVAPEEWGWEGYFYSGADQQYRAAHGYQGSPDKDAHGGMDYLPWLLSQMAANQQATGQRLLDVFSVHYYPQGGEFGGGTDTAMQLRRNRSTRSLWDPNYTDESWINDKVMLIPRIKGWVNTYYPGTKTALTEYNWGAESSINGATTQADIFGIFGREGLDMATRWTTPAPSTPTYQAMKLYRNYDGSKSGFGDTSVSDSAPSPDNLSSFAALRSSDGALTVMVISKVLQGDTPVTVSLANFNGAGTAHAWQLTGKTNAITSLTDVPISGSALTATVPAQSVTLFVIPAAVTSPPPATPTGLSAAAGHGQVALTWGPVSGAVTYNVYRAATSGGEGTTAFKTGLTSPAFTDMGVTNGVTYFYQATAVNANGESVKSGEASARPTAPGVALNAGGGATGGFLADADFTGGHTYTMGAAVGTAGVAGAAPAAVYQSERNGNVTYAVPGLTAGASYTVRLHFAEIYWNAAGLRVFNVAINGTPVLSNFDVFQTAGGKNKAVVKTFATTADSAGKVTITFTTIKNNAKVSGIEVF